MTPRQSIFSSSIGSKFLIALSGLSLVAFLILHLIGNLMVFVSADAFNHYGDKLINNPLLIPAELGLVALFLLHVGKTIALVHERAAREARALRRQASRGSHQPQELGVHDDDPVGRVPVRVRAVAPGDVQVRAALRLGEPSRAFATSIA